MRNIEQLAVNTNHYAELKLNSKTKPGNQCRKWHKTEASELRVWIGLIIRMGLHKEPSTSLYWSKGGSNGWRKIKKATKRVQWPGKQKSYQQYRIPKSCMSLNRYEQLKRYFHISDPRISLEKKDWYKKVDPLASILQERYRSFYLPSTKVAIDEMVVRFSGRSHHTLKIRNKPVKEGYKIFALCSHGYTYGFIWYSSSVGLANIPPQSNLTPTSAGVLSLAQLLPSNHCWHLILDNYFTNVPLFERLLLLGIGAAGTTRVDAAGFPQSLKIDKAEARKVLAWGFVTGAVVQNTCCLVWQDNSSVLFMTTYHDIRETVERMRRRPKKSSTNGTIVRSLFGEEARKLLPIPTFIDDYNYHMGAVDIADQLRSYYCTQQTARRNWYPLFYWLLDTTIVNAYRMQRILSPGRKYKSQHFHFRLQLANTLIETGLMQSQLSTTKFPAPKSPSHPSMLSHTGPYASHHTTAPESEQSTLIAHPLPSSEPGSSQVSRSQASRCEEKRFYVLNPKKSKHSHAQKPVPISFPTPQTHRYEQRPTHTRCILCRWYKLHETQRTVRSVNGGCQECDYALCRSCFPIFHGSSHIE